MRLYRRTMQTPSRVLGRTTTRILVVVRQLVAPLAGALFFVLWFVAEYTATATTRRPSSSLSSRS